MTAALRRCARPRISAIMGRCAAGAPRPSGPRSARASLGKVRIQVFDLAGRVVRTLVDGLEPAGPHQVGWDGSGRGGQRLAAGVYFYRIETPGWQSTGKLVLLNP